ncbi:MAG: TetR/AcrR family transcriptional regulator [Oscillospiraceae bacterium]|jgi:TetR/AcrR family fatty acid metabolism transcriptional regulator
MPSSNMMPKRNKVKMIYKKSAMTRERIYKAAIALMKEKGYQGASIRDICKRASVSPGTFYSYFESKLDILKEIYRPGDEFFRTAVIKELESKDFFQQLRIFFSAYARLNINTGIDVMRVLFNPENEWFTHPRSMQEVLAIIIRYGMECNILSEETNVRQMVDNIFTVLRGVCFAWCIYNASFDLEERMLEHLDYMLKGMFKFKEEPEY